MFFDIDHYYKQMNTFNQNNNSTVNYSNLWVLIYLLKASKIMVCKQTAQIEKHSEAVIEHKLCICS